MKEFATPLRIVGNITLSLINKLVNLGYVINNIKDSDEGALLTFWDSSNINKLSNNRLSNNKLGREPFKHSTGYEFGLDRFNIDAANEELVLALAAMTRGEVIYPGEYVYMLTNYAHPYLITSHIYKVLKLQDKHKKIENQDRDTCFILDHIGQDSYLAPFRLCFRKATKEELIKHFSKDKDMTNNSDTLMAGIEQPNKKVLLGYKVKEGVNRTSAYKAIDKVLYSQNVLNQSYRGQNIDIEGNSIYEQIAKENGVLDLLFDPIYKQIEKEVTIEGLVFKIGKNEVLYTHSAQNYLFKKQDLIDFILTHGSDFSLSDISYRVKEFAFGCNYQIIVTMNCIKQIVKIMEEL